MNTKLIWKLMMLVAAVFVFAACSDDDDWNTRGDGQVRMESSSRAFILNEGSLNRNNSSLTYFDWRSGLVDSADIYYAQNGSSLGDTGNDILTVGNNKLVVAVNVTNFVALLDGYGVEKSRVDFSRYANLGQVRCLTRDGNKIYATSTGGYVSRLDISGNTLSYGDSLKVGERPEGIAQLSGKLYVALQGTAYNDNRLAVVEKDFQTVSYATIMQDPNKVYTADGKVYITGYGAYYDNPWGVYDPAAGQYSELGHASSIAVGDGVIYTAYSATDWSTYETTTTLSAYNPKTGNSEAFFQNVPAAVSSTTVYSLSYNCYNKKVYVATSDYVSDGVIHVFSPQGAYESSFSAFGLNPNKIVFLK